MALFGSGLGSEYAPPADGTASPGPIPLSAGIEVFVGGAASAYSYAGVAPGLAGVDQVNVLIPANTTEGCAIPVEIRAGGFQSPTAALSIARGRGQCTDPPLHSYGRITLLRTVATNTGDGGETDSGGASFLSGPGAQPPMIDFGNQPPVTRQCNLPGTSTPATGPIQVQAPNGSAVPSVNGTLPAGFVGAGPYTFTASGSTVSFAGSAVLPGPIRFTSTPVSPALPNQPLVINWNGGDTSSTVRLTLTSLVNGVIVTGTTSAAAGTFSFSPFCSGFNGQQLCSYGIPPGGAQLQVHQVPNGGTIPLLAASGLTLDVQVVWDYRFLFGQLSVPD